MTPNEEAILNDAMEHSADINHPTHWKKFVSRLIETHSVKIMGMFWKFFEEFDVISDEQLKIVLINALKVAIKQAIYKRPARIEELNDPSLLKYYNQMVAEYEKGMKMNG